MIDDEQAPEELAPDPLAQIICEGCGREFQVVGTGDHQILFEPETGQSDPEYLICRCGCHLWVEEAEGGQRVVQFFSVEDRATIAAQMRPLPDRLPTPEEADRILIEAGYNPAEVAERMNAVARRALRSRHSWLVRLLARLLHWLESRTSPGQK